MNDNTILIYFSIFIFLVVVALLIVVVNVYISILNLLKITNNLKYLIIKESVMPEKQKISEMVKYINGRERNE